MQCNSAVKLVAQNSRPPARQASLQHPPAPRTAHQGLGALGLEAPSGPAAAAAGAAASAAAAALAAAALGHPPSPQSSSQWGGHPAPRLHGHICLCMGALECAWAHLRIPGEGAGAGAGLAVIMCMRLMPSGHTISVPSAEVQHQYHNNTPISTTGYPTLKYHNSTPPVPCGFCDPLVKCHDRNTTATLPRWQQLTEARACSCLFEWQQQPPART